MITTKVPEVAAFALLLIIIVFLGLWLGVDALLLLSVLGLSSTGLIWASNRNGILPKTLVSFLQPITAGLALVLLGLIVVNVFWQSGNRWGLNRLQEMLVQADAIVAKDSLVSEALGTAPLLAFIVILTIISITFANARLFSAGLKWKTRIQKGIFALTIVTCFAFGAEHLVRGPSTIRLRKQIDISLSAARNQQRRAVSSFAAYEISDSVFRKNKNMKGTFYSCVAMLPFIWRNQNRSNASLNGSRTLFYSAWSKFVGYRSESDWVVSEVGKYHSAIVAKEVGLPGRLKKDVATPQLADQIANVESRLDDSRHWSQRARIAEESFRKFIGEVGGGLYGEYIDKFSDGLTQILHESWKQGGNDLISEICDEGTGGILKLNHNRWTHCVSQFRREVLIRITAVSLSKDLSRSVDALSWKIKYFRAVRNYDYELDRFFTRHDEKEVPAGLKLAQKDLSNLVDNPPPFLSSESSVEVRDLTEKAKRLLIPHSQLQQRKAAEAASKAAKRIRKTFKRIF